VQSLDIDLDALPPTTDTASYAGLMLGLPGGGLDISQGQFIEIWVNDLNRFTARGGAAHRPHHQRGATTQAIPPTMTRTRTARICRELR
jgi:hypothetical protein